MMVSLIIALVRCNRLVLQPHIERQERLKETHRVARQGHKNCIGVSRSYQKRHRVAVITNASHGRERVGQRDCLYDRHANGVTEGAEGWQVFDSDVPQYD